MSHPLPSGTVVVLRDAPRLEVLLLARAPRDGKPGPWVFPGGKVEPGDLREGDHEERNARRAAVRETHEESSLRLDEETLVPISRWVTPKISPKRFDTWFYAARVPPDAPVVVDGEEMCDHRWLAPAAALDAHHAHDLRLAPPTFVTVTWLAEFVDAAEALRVLPGRMPPPFHPRIHRMEVGACMIYPGDVAYETGEFEATGARHRLWIAEEPWRYERKET